MAAVIAVPVGVVSDRPTTEQCAEMFALFVALSESEQARIYAFLAQQKERKKK